MSNYTKTRRTDNTVRIDTPLGHRLWLERLYDDTERIQLHTSICLAGHMHFVDDINELPYVIVTAVKNHEKELSPDVRSTVEMTACTDRALTCLVEDLPALFEQEFHEQLLQEQSQKGGAA